MTMAWNLGSQKVLVFPAPHSLSFCWTPYSPLLSALFQFHREQETMCLFVLLHPILFYMASSSILMQIIQYPSFGDHTDMCFEPTLTQNSKPIVERDANANYPDLILTRYIHVHSHHPERIKTHN